MKFLRYLLPIAVAAVGFTSTANAGCSLDPFHNEERQRDFEAVQEFVNSKRTIGLDQKICNLTISGDIRFEWANIIERSHCHKLRGKDGTAREINLNGEAVVVDTGDPEFAARDPVAAEIIRNGCGRPFSTNAFAVEFNLYFDYVCDRAWGVAWLQFNEDAGIEENNSNRKGCCEDRGDRHGLFGSGCCGSLCLKKAYMGYNVFADGCSRFDIELGRRPLYTVFDSRVQFQNRFDGILLRFNHLFECYGDFYWNLGAFVVDERADHYAWVTEVGLMNIADCGFDLKYSFIDWKSLLRNNRNGCNVRNPRGAQYQVSQFTFAYHVNPEYLCMPAKIYGALLFNSAAKNRTFNTAQGTAVHFKRENYAWYLGFIIGQVCREGDWSFDVNYQYVLPQSIPDSDIGGIGSGGNNLLGDTYSANQRGHNNYKGWRFEALYAITDNLSLDASLEFSEQAVRRPSGEHKYSKFELEAIYAF